MDAINRGLFSEGKSRAEKDRKQMVEWAGAKCAVVFCIMVEVWEGTETSQGKSLIAPMTSEGNETQRGSEL